MENLGYDRRAALAAWRATQRWLLPSASHLSGCPPLLAPTAPPSIVTASGGRAGAGEAQALGGRGGALRRPLPSLKQIPKADPFPATTPLRWSVPFLR